MPPGEGKDHAGKVHHKEKDGAVKGRKQEKGKRAIIRAVRLFGGMICPMTLALNREVPVQTLRWLPSSRVAPGPGGRSRPVRARVKALTMLVREFQRLHGVVPRTKRRGRLNRTTSHQYNRINAVPRAGQAR